MSTPLTYEEYKEHRELREGSFARTMYAGYLRDWRSRTVREIAARAVNDMTSFGASLCGSGLSETGADMLAKAERYRALLIDASDKIIEATVAEAAE